MTRKKLTAVTGETASGAVKIITGKKALQAIEDAKKQVHQKVIDEAQQKETMPEDMTELEKDLKVYLSGKGDSEQKKTIEDIFGDK